MESEDQLLREKPIYSKIVAIQRLPNYNLKNPVYVSLEFFPDIVHADHFDTESWAEGENEYEALDGIRFEIEDLYEHLCEMPDVKLGDKLKSWKRLLANMIED